MSTSTSTPASNGAASEKDNVPRVFKKRPPPTAGGLDDDLLRPMTHVRQKTQPEWQSKDETLSTISAKKLPSPEASTLLPTASAITEEETSSTSNPKPIDSTRAQLFQKLQIGMSPDQVAAFHLLTATSHNYLLSGSAGCGKSWLLERVIEALVACHGADAVQVTASTGIAALNIGGKTLHSFAGIGLGDKDVSEHRRAMTATDVSRWRQVQILIVDEVSMVSPQYFDKLDQIGRIIRRRDATFGGIRVLVCGDFFQLPPIVPRPPNGEKSPTAFVFDAKCWHPSSSGPANAGFRSIILTANHRQIEMSVETNTVGVVNGDGSNANTNTNTNTNTDTDTSNEQPTFKHLLDACRRGDLSHEQYQALSGRVLINLNRPPTGLLQSLYGYNISPSCSGTERVAIINRAQKEMATEDAQRLALATYMFPRRSDVDRMNRQRLDATADKASEREFACRYWSDKTAEGLAALSLVRRDCIAPDVLPIRVGALVVLLKNLNLEQGLANGAQGVVVVIHEKFDTAATTVAQKNDYASPLSLPPSSSPPPSSTTTTIFNYADDGKPALTVAFANGCVAHVGLKKWETFGKSAGHGADNDDDTSPNFGVANEVPSSAQDASESRLSKRKAIAAKYQLPFALGWAITIHKSQGMTLENVVVDIANCFEPGMAYVALSRATSIRGVFIKSSFPRFAVRADKRVHQFYTNVANALDGVVAHTEIPTSTIESTSGSTSTTEPMSPPPATSETSTTCHAERVSLCEGRLLPLITRLQTLANVHEQYCDSPYPDDIVSDGLMPNLIIRYMSNPLTRHVSSIRNLPNRDAESAHYECRMFCEFVCGRVDAMMAIPWNVRKDVVVPTPTASADTAAGDDETPVEFAKEQFRSTLTQARLALVSYEQSHVSGNVSDPTHNVDNK